MSSSVLTHLDGYCERAGQAGLFAEPFNAITNLCFIAAAYFILRALRQLPKAPLKTHLDIWLLVVSLFAIGIGSGLWHMQPNGSTLLMDVIPIGLFINIYLIAALRRLFGLGWGRALLWWVIYTVAGVVAQKQLPPDTLNGTIMYIPTFLTLAVMTAVLWGRDRATGKAFAGVLLVWSVSLTFRTIDMEICSRFALGTHFLWHTLNAWVLWRLLSVLIGRVRSGV